MSIFKWPFKRKQYPAVGNPLFIGDVVAANEAVMDALIAITGLGLTDFAIISGMPYTSGTPGSFGPGIFYLNGIFYYTDFSFSENLYLTPDPQDIENQPFGDTVSRPTYTEFHAVTAGSSGPATTPQFVGNMNAFRISNSVINTALQNLLTLFGTLGSAAFRNVGTTPGTVAAGDDTRFGYSVAQINSLFALKTQVLLFGNTTPFTPTLTYEPATKTYADQAAGCKLLWVGQIDAGASVITKQGPAASSIVCTVAHIGTGHYRISHNIGNTNYFVTGMGQDLGSQLASPRSFSAASSSQFDYYVSDDSSANDAAVQLEIWAFF